MAPSDDLQDGNRDANRDEIRDAAALVDASARIVVLTGAGISTESGIPDFRGPSGVWTKDPAAEKRAHIDVYRNDPDVREGAWRRRLEISDEPPLLPNDGHRALVELERRGTLDLLVTQNIDSLHHAAGSDPDRIVEVHGHGREVVCLQCEMRAPMARALARVRAGEVDPPCRECGGILKAATISFGQSLVEADLERAFLAAANADLLVAIGSTLSVYPVAEMVPIARRQDVPLIIVNADPTPFDAAAEVVVRGRIGEVLPAIVGVG